MSHPPQYKEEDRYTVKQSNKDRPPRDRWLRRIWRHLREWTQDRGRIVSDQMLRGASYSLGSGAVSILILWMEARR
jgi:hypothetical protein